MQGTQLGAESEDGESEGEGDDERALVAAELIPSTASQHQMRAMAIRN